MDLASITDSEFSRRAARAWRIALVAYLVPVSVATHWPRLGFNSGGPIDKFVHFLAFGVLAWLWMNARPWGRPSVGWLLAAAWVSSGAIERGSLWAALLQAAGLGLSSLALAIVAFLFLIDGVEPPSGPVGLVLRAVSVGAGAIGALLVADGVARLLQSMSGESLDEESDSDAARRAG